MLARDAEGQSGVETSGNKRKHIKMYETVTKLDPYEFDGEERKGLPNEADELHVKSHRIWNDRVVLDWRGHSITVNANDLRIAVENATRR